MKNTKICPKCGSNDILRIEGTNNGYGGGNNIKSSVFGVALVTRYLCCNCGFSEEWIEKDEDIKKLKKKYSKS